MIEKTRYVLSSVSTPHDLIVCWGFAQLDTDEETSRLLSTITPFGVFKSKKLPEGVKQGPAIYQHMQDNAIGSEFKPSGDIFATFYSMIPTSVASSSIGADWSLVAARFMPAPLPPGRAG